MDPGRTAPPDPFVAVDEEDRQRRLRAVPPPQPAEPGFWTINLDATPTEPGVWSGLDSDGRPVRLRTHAIDGSAPSEADLVAIEQRRRAIGHQCVPAIRRSARASDGRLVLIEETPRGSPLEALFLDLQRGHPPACLSAMSGRLAVATRLAELIARAHAGGIVHGSLAPDVILVTADGELFVDGWPPTCRDLVKPPASRWNYGPAHYQAPEAARGEPATEAGDVYAVAAIAHHLLVGRPPLISTTGTQSWIRKTEGVIDPLTATERAQVPDALTSAITLGLASEPALRPDASAYAAALQGASDACLAVAAAHATPRHRRPWWLVAAIVALAAAGVAWIRFGPESRWDRPSIVETFADADWSQRWQTARGRFERVPLGVGTTVGTANVLVYEQRMSPQVAIEYDARMAPGATAGDLSFKWLPSLEGASPQDTAFGPGTINVQIGAYDNRYALIEYGNRLAQAPLTLEAGRIYRVRVELDEDRIDLELDGVKLLSARTLFPLPSGHPALYGYYGGKEFGNVRIRSRSPQTTISPLAVGDAFFSEGQWKSAQIRYLEVARAHAGTALGQSAQFRLGLSCLREGDTLAAGRAWQPLAKGPWQPRIDLALARSMLETGEWATAQALTESVLAHAPELRAQALELWAAGVSRRIREMQYVDADRLEQTWRTLLGGDRMAGDVAQRLLLNAGRFDRVLTDPDSAAYAPALCAIGRTDEVLQRFPHNRNAMMYALMQRGEFERLIDEFPEHQWAVGQALYLLDRIEDIPRLAPLEMSLVHELQGELRLDLRPESMAIHRVRVLLAQERFAEAEEAANAVPLTSATVSVHAHLACALGRSEQFNAMLRQRGADSLPNLADQAFQAIAAGDVAGGAAIIDGYMAWPNLAGAIDRPYEVSVLPAWAALCAKGPEAARQVLSGIVEHRRHQQGQRPWHIAALALGKIGIEEFRAQPMRFALDGDQALALALNAELIGDHAGALAHYRTWSSLPPLRRSVSFPVLVARFVAQRIEALSSQPR